MRRVFHRRPVPLDHVHDPSPRGTQGPEIRTPRRGRGKEGEVSARRGRKAEEGRGRPWPGVARDVRMWRASAPLAARGRPWRRSKEDGMAAGARGASGERGDGAPTLQPWVKYCSSCGGEVEAAVPEGDSRWRHVCTTCGKIDYQNPKMVVGCIVEHQGRMLLCKRGIEPCKGKWTLPAGFMELGESALEGAKRETLEEVKAKVDVHAPFAHFDIPRIGQAYILFRGSLASPYEYGIGAESLEAKLFHLDDIPYAEIAFSSITIAIQKYVEDRRAGRYSVHHGIIDKKPGSSPNDSSGYELRGYFATPTVHTV